MSSPTASFVDPLCSVVPCSISSENACSTLAENQKDKVDTGKCSSPTQEHDMANLQRTPLNFEFVHGKGLDVHVINGEGSRPTVRRQLTSLRNYSMLLPSHHAFSERECSVTDLTNEAINYDETAKEKAELTKYRQKEKSSPLILNLGKNPFFQGSEVFLHDVGEENPEQTGVPKRDIELPQSKNLQKAESQCKNAHSTQVPGRKRVHFSEAETNIPLQKKLQTVQIMYRNCSTTRTGKRLKSSNPHSKSRVQEAKGRLTKCNDKDWKRLIFRNIEFLLTGFSGKKEKEIEGLIRKYGGMVLSDIPSPNTRGKRNYSRAKLQPLPVILCFKKLQTTKFLYGCAVNACMVKVNWLTDSIAEGSVLPPYKYMILPNHVGKKYMRVGKPVLCSNHLFDRVGIMLHGKHNFCTKMAVVVKHGGGLVFKTLQWLVHSLDSEKISLGAIVTEDESRVSRHLKHCASEQKIPMMLASWIINSLHVGKLLPLMENNHSSTPSLPIKLLGIPVSMELSEEI